MQNKMEDCTCANASFGPLDQDKDRSHGAFKANVSRFMGLKQI